MFQDFTAEMRQLSGNEMLERLFGTRGPSRFLLPSFLRSAFIGRFGETFSLPIEDISPRSWTIHYGNGRDYIFQAESCREIVRLRNDPLARGVREICDAIRKFSLGRGFISSSNKFYLIHFSANFQLNYLLRTIAVIIHRDSSAL